MSKVQMPISIKYYHSFNEQGYRTFFGDLDELKRKLGQLDIAMTDIRSIHWNGFIFKGWKEFENNYNHYFMVIYND